MRDKIWLNPNLIPPILHDFHRLASGERDTLVTYRQQRRDPERELELKLWAALRMLGYELIEMGHRSPGQRVPDGIAIGRPSRSAAICDGKTAGDGYDIAGDVRALEDYVREFHPGLARQGVDCVYLVVIAGSFRGNLQEHIRRMKQDLRGMLANLVLLRADVLQYLVQLRLLDPLTIDERFLAKVFHHSSLNLSFEEVKERYDEELSVQDKLRPLPVLL